MLFQFRHHHRLFSHARPILVTPNTTLVRSSEPTGTSFLKTMPRWFSAANTSTAEHDRASPRPSASIIVVNERNEILMVKRTPLAKSFPAATVFPGGNYDSAQDSSLQYTAIRETFEEAGLLLACPPLTPDRISQEEFDNCRKAVHTNSLRFLTFLDRYNLGADLNALLKFTNWTTPENVKRRFRTQFFVAFLNKEKSYGFSSGIKQESLPTINGGEEIVSARFLHPDDVLSEFREKKITMMPPQYYLLYTLSNILKGSVNTEEQRSQILRLSEGPFGDLSIRPKPVPLGVGKDGRRRAMMTYEGDETRGGPPGRLHRSIVQFEENGVTSEIDLQRNFDIFTDIPLECPPPSSKL